MFCPLHHLQTINKTAKSKGLCGFGNVKCYIGENTIKKLCSTFNALLVLLLLIMVMLLCSCGKSSTNNKNNVTQEIVTEQTNENTNNKEEVLTPPVEEIIIEYFKLKEVYVEISGTNIDQLSRLQLNLMLVNLNSDGKVLYAFKSYKKYQLATFGIFMVMDISSRGDYILKTANKQCGAELNFNFVKGSSDLVINANCNSVVEIKEDKITVTFTVKILESTYISVVYTVEQVNNAS